MNRPTLNTDKHINPQNFRSYLYLGHQLLKLLIACLSVMALGNVYAADGQTPPPVPPRITGPLYKSIDSGATWFPINTGVSCQLSIVLAANPSSPGVLYAGTDRGVFKTTDGGNHWVQANGIISLFHVGRLVVDSLNPALIYAGGHSYSGSAVFKSDDGGLSWMPIKSDGISNYGFQFVIDPRNHTTLYIQDETNLYKSTDGGNRWGSILNYPFTGQDAFPADLEFDATDSSILYVTARGHLYKSTNGGSSWVDMTDRVAQVSKTNSYLELRINPIDTSIIYLKVFLTGELVKTTDGGETWQIATDDNSLRMANLVAASTSPPSLYADQGMGLLKSTDQGNTWIKTGTRPVVDAIALDSASPSTIYVGGSDGSPQLFQPWILGFVIEGKKLFIIGQVFDEGAVILLDGEEQPTKNDEEKTSTMLIGKKAGKKIRKNPNLKIQVKNPNGELSQEVTIWPPID